MSSVLGEMGVETPSIEVVEAQHEHLPQLDPMIEYWMMKGTIYPTSLKEVFDVQQALAEGVNGDNQDKYFVAMREGKVLGMMGVQSPASYLLPYTETQKPTSIISALIDSQQRRTGVGKTLVRAITEHATTEGATEIIVSSTDKYRRSGGWNFWQKQYGEPVGRLEFAPGREMLVWRQDLNTSRRRRQHRQNT